MTAKGIKKLAPAIGERRRERLLKASPMASCRASAAMRLEKSAVVH